MSRGARSGYARLVVLFAERANERRAWRSREEETIVEPHLVLRFSWAKNPRDC